MLTSFAILTISVKLEAGILKKTPNVKIIPNGETKNRQIWSP
jgi:hypothetical protein